MITIDVIVTLVLICRLYQVIIIVSCMLRAYENVFALTFMTMTKDRQLHTVEYCNYEQY